MILKARDDEFGNFKNAVFLAVVLGAGATIWAQSKQSADLERRITILELGCVRKSTISAENADG
jgi:hypothetical protein